MATTEQLIFDILARDNASAAFIRAGGSAKDAAGNVKSLTDRLIEVSKQSVNARVGLQGNKEANAGIDQLQAKLIKLGEKTANPNITVEGALKAQAEITRVELEMDKLGKKVAKPRVQVLAEKAAGAGALAPSLGGTLLGLSPAAIPLLAGVTAGTVALGISLTAAAGGAAAFGLLAKQAFSGAYTAASAVNLAQNTYNASIDAGTKKAVAYRTEQKAINLAYAEMTPAQIRLSKTIGDMQDAWQGVQQATTPLITGALMPWVKDLTGLLKYITPVITPVAAVFRDWGQSLGRLIASAPSSEISKLAAAFGRFSASQLKDVGTFIGDIAGGIFSLGKDLSGAGANLGAAGGWLTGMGTGFLTWSKSAQARSDVQGFLHYLHTEGPVVSSILKDLARYIPGIFAGVSTGGALELKALSDLLGLIAKLPASWAKPLTEAAGAILLLAKTGVLKVGFTVIGTAAGWLKKLFGGASVDIGGTAAAAEIRAAMVSGGVAAAAEIRAAMAGGGVVAGAEGAAGSAGGAGAGAGAAEGGVAGTALTRAGWTSGALATALRIPLAAAIGTAAAWAVGHLVAAFVPPATKKLEDAYKNSTPGIAQAIENFLLGGKAAVINDAITRFQDMIKHGIDVAYQYVINKTTWLQQEVRRPLDIMRHDTADVFDGIRNDIATIWDTISHNVITVVTRLGHQAEGLFDDFRHSTANIFDGVRTDIAGAWDLIWRNTVTRVEQGIATVVGWFKGMPGRLVGALAGMGTALYNAGHFALTEFWNGLKSVASTIGSWFMSFGHTVIGIVKKVLGVFSPSSVFYDIGKNLMAGLRNGIIDHARSAVQAAQGTAHQVSAAGAGVQRWAGLVRQALAMENLSPSLLGNVLYQMQTESGGNPNAINLSDINAQQGDPSRGLMQTIMSTFQAYHWPGTSQNIYDPLANIAAALNYARHVYGPGLERGGMGIGSGHGYATGSWNVPSTGPATVHKGEMILPAELASRVRGTRGGGALVNVQGNLVIRERADASRLARDLAFQITAAGMGR